MTFLTLGLILLIAAGQGMLSVVGLLKVRKGVSVPMTLAISLGYSSLLFLRPDPVWVSNLSVLVAGSCIGFLLGQFLRSPASVLTFLGTAAVVDLLSFSDGLTNQILEAYRTGGSTLLRFLAVFVEMGGQEYAVVGVSDIALVSAAYLGLLKAADSSIAPAIFLLFGLLAAFLVGMVTTGVPAIPFLAAAAGIFVFRRHRYLAAKAVGS